MWQPGVFLQKGIVWSNTCDSRSRSTWDFLSYQSEVKMIGGLLFLSLLGFCFGLECMEDERKCPPEPWAPEGYCIEAVRLTYAICIFQWLILQLIQFQEWSWIDDETGEEKSCPNWCSANCDDDSEKWCWGGVDDNDCSLPSFCQPFVSMIWNNSLAKLVPNTIIECAHLEHMAKIWWWHSMWKSLPWDMWI